MRKLPAFFFFLLLLGCGDPPKEATFSTLHETFKVSCNFSSCHGSALPQYGNLKLSDADAYCYLVGATAGATTRMTAKGDFPRRVVPGNRGQSFLYKKLTLTNDESGVMKPLGSRMPLGAMLEPAQLDLFGRWIDAGAKDDNPTAGPCM